MTQDIKEALAQPRQEPVAWLSTDSIGEQHLCFDKPLDNDPVQPLYTTPPQRTEQEPVAWEQFYPDIGKPQIEQPKVRTGDCLLVGVCASEGHKIQAKQEQEEYLSKAYRLANELRCHLAIAPAPQRTWVGLTNDELTDLFYNTNLGQQSAVAQAIALLKERNT